jgi:fused-like protein
MLITACGDEDANVRKFACFGLGNAAFHTDELYSNMRTSVALLNAALKDEDDKTRANAAGALGNLCRNSGLLSESISQQQVVHQLVLTAISDSSESCQVRNTPMHYDHTCNAV